MCDLRYCLTALLLVVLLAVPGSGEAAAPIRISPAGAGVYSISAVDLPDTAGIDLTVAYDEAAFDSPVVKAGSLTVGAMMQANVSKAGIVRIIFITGGSILGTGELASVSFTGKGKAPAWQPKLDPPPSAYSAAGSQIAVQPVTDTSSSDPNAGGSKDSTTGSSSASASTGSSGGNTTSSSTSSSGTSSGTVTGQTGTTVGTVALPQEQVSRSEAPREEVRRSERREEDVKQTQPSQETESAAAARPPVARDLAPAVVPPLKNDDARQTLKSSQSVAERFQAYKESRTVKRLAKLFDVSALRSAGIVQTPAIAVSDGTSLVTVSVEPAGDSDTPSFSLKGANLKAIRRVSDKKWELDALPQKNRTDVRLSIILKGERTEIPLIAVPVLSQAGAGIVALSDAELDALLAKPFKNGKPAYDLNSDGSQDYLDDYILVAHWLLKQQQDEKKKSQKQPAAGK